MLDQMADGEKKRQKYMVKKMLPDIEGSEFGLMVEMAMNDKTEMPEPVKLFVIEGDSDHIRETAKAMAERKDEMVEH